MKMHLFKISWLVLVSLFVACNQEAAPSKSPSLNTSINTEKIVTLRPLAISGTTVLVSVGRDASGNAVPANNISSADLGGPSVGTAISADGRFVAFTSLASNLVDGDTNGFRDVFVRDTLTGSTELVSRASGSAGTLGNQTSRNPSSSSDGRYIAFESGATNLVTGGSLSTNIFLRDRLTTTTTQISSSLPGGLGPSVNPAISADGRFVVYSSTGQQAALDTNLFSDIYVHDAQTQTRSLVSVGVGTTGNVVPASGNSLFPAISDNGRFVVFQSQASNLVSGLSGTVGIQIYVRDLQLGITRLVSGNALGNYSQGGNQNPFISGDGRFVVFVSNSTDLLSTDTDTIFDVYVRDLQTAALSLASVGSGGKANGANRWPVINENGRYISFSSDATNLSSSDTLGDEDVFRHDRQTGLTELISQSTTGVNGVGESEYPAISANGLRVVFESVVSTLVSGDSNGFKDVFLREIAPPDVTPPVIIPNVTGTLGTNGWYTSDITVTWSVTDAESGVNPSTGCNTVVLSTDTAETSLTCTASSNGGSGSQSITLKRDATPPTATVNVPAPNTNGWHPSSITVTFAGADALSGVAGCTAAMTLNEGANQSASGSCTDNAGNSSASVVASGINVDLTPPVVSVLGVVNGASYPLGSVPTASCDAQDLLSGVTNTATLTVTGGPTGSVTVSCLGATDQAGNMANANVTFTVTAAGFTFDGFLSPVVNRPGFNRAKAGQSIPMKFRLGGNQGLAVLASGYPASRPISCDTLALVGPLEVAVSNPGLTYDATNQQYSFVWKTVSGWAGSCREFVLRLSDGSVHAALIQFR